MTGKLLTDAQVRARLGGKSQRTIDRWTSDQKLGFPPAIYIRGRKFRSLEAVEAFEAKLIAGAGQSYITPAIRKVDNNCRACRSVPGWVCGNNVATQRYYWGIVGAFL
jgi:hypothetical protein